MLPETVQIVEIESLEYLLIFMLLDITLHPAVTIKPQIHAQIP